MTRMAVVYSAQKSWRVMIDNDCKFILSQFEGKSARSMMLSKCYSTHGLQRIDQIRYRLCGSVVFECEAISDYDYLFKEEGSL